MVQIQKLCSWLAGSFGRVENACFLSRIMIRNKEMSRRVAGAAG